MGEGVASHGTEGALLGLQQKQIQEYRSWRQRTDKKLTLPNTILSLILQAVALGQIKIHISRKASSKKFLYKSF